MVKNPSECRRPGYNLWVGKNPLRTAWQPAPASILAWGIPMGRGACPLTEAGYSPWGCKELDMTEWLSRHSYQDWRGIQAVFYNHLTGVHTLSLCPQSYLYSLYSNQSVIAPKETLKVGSFGRQHARSQEFPGNPVVKNTCFHCRCNGFDPWWGTSDLAYCVAAKKKKRQIAQFEKLRIE